MFRFFAKSVLATVVWRHYKRLIVSSLVLFASYFLIGMMHEDYLEYLHRSESTYSVGLAYVLKWFALFAVSAIYYLINFPPKRKLEKKIMADKSLGASPAKEVGATEDPFAKIRRKQKLDGRGDKILKN